MVNKRVGTFTLFWAETIGIKLGRLMVKRIAAALNK